MAKIETWFNQDLKQAVKVHYLDGNVFSADNAGNIVGVYVFDGDESATLSGSVSASVIRSDGVTVSVAGSLSGNKAYVVLPQSAYSVPGVISIVIKLTNGTEITTLCAVVSNVYMSTTDTVVDPGTIIPSVETLIAAIEAAVATIPADYSALWTSLAPAYSTAQAYNVGDYCTYDGGLYRCNTKISPSESWTPAHWELSALSQGITGFNDKLDRLTGAFKSRNLSYDLVELYGETQNITRNGVTYSWNGFECTVSGSATSNSFCNFLVISVPRDGVKVPATVNVAMEGNFQHVSVQAFAIKNGSTLETQTISASGFIQFTNATADTYAFRLLVPSGNTASGKIRARVYSMDMMPFGTWDTMPPANGTNVNDLKENGVYILDSNYTFINPPPLSPAYIVVFRMLTTVFQFAIGYHSVQGCYVRVMMVNGTWEAWRPFNMTGYDLALIANNGTVNVDDITQTGCYLMYDALNYINSPITGVGFIFVYNMMNVVLQIAIPYLPNAIYMRRKITNGSWSGWVSAAGGNTYNINNNFSFPEYSQTLTVQATPSITTDTNNYLAPTGTTADRTADILSMLSTTGVCRLGAGDYYINGLQMPEQSAIYGSGTKTRVIMTNAQNGFAIKMNSLCILDGFSLYGQTSSYTPGATEGNRVGILWQGTYSADQTAPERGMISNLYINNFTGSGIKCYDTGTGTVNNLLANNLFIYSCWAGINIAYSSEFHKFTNVRASYCRFGCINNGGNNMFVNCDFSHSREVGMLMDNSQGQSPNNSHGSCVGCTFNHTFGNGQSNKGTGIKILNCENGFTFSSCQIFFSKVELIDAIGIVFDSNIFGYSNCDITISGGGAVLFNGNMFQSRPPITVTSNPNVHFVYNYNRTTGVIIEP